MIGKLTANGVLVDFVPWKKSLGAKFSDVLPLLRVTATLRVGPREIVKTTDLFQQVYIDKRLYYLIARFTARRLVQRGFLLKVVNFLEVPASLKPALISQIVLSEDQEIIFKKLTEVYANRRGNYTGCVLVLGTGYGKTYIAMHLIAYLNVKTLIVAPKRSIIDGWRGDLTKSIAAPVSTYPRGYLATAPIHLMTIKSAIKDVFKIGKKEIAQADFWAAHQFGLVVYDEIPDFVSMQHQNVFWRVGTQFTLGLTATPGERLDKMDAVYEAHAGPLLRATEIPGFNPEAVSFDGEIQIIKYQGPAHFTKHLVNRANKMMSYINMVKQLASDPARNALIIRETLALFKSGKNVYVFCATRDHVAYLCNRLRAEGVLFEAPEIASILIGGSKEEDIEQARARARIILTTFSYGGTGVSIVKMDALVFATMRKGGIRQILGRICRRGGDASSRRIIVDIVDTETKLREQLRARRLVYEEKNFPIIERRLSYREIVDQTIAVNTVTVLAARSGAKKILAILAKWLVDEN